MRNGKMYCWNTLSPSQAVRSLAEYEKDALSQPYLTIRSRVCIDWSKLKFIYLRYECRCRAPDWSRRRPLGRTLLRASRRPRICSRSSTRVQRRKTLLSERITSSWPIQNWVWTKYVTTSLSKETWKKVAWTKTALTQPLTTFIRQQWNATCTYLVRWRARPSFWGTWPCVSPPEWHPRPGSAWTPRSTARSEIGKGRGRGGRSSGRRLTRLRSPAESRRKPKLWVARTKTAHTQPTTFTWTAKYVYPISHSLCHNITESRLSMVTVRVTPGDVANFSRQRNARACQWVT